MFTTGFKFYFGVGLALMTAAFAYGYTTGGNSLPDPVVVVTEHRAERYRCRCGCETTAEFPSEAPAPACYGPSIKAHALYLMCAQHLPRERCALALTDLFGVDVSTGTLDNWMSQAAGALDGFVATVSDQLGSAPVVHADETRCVRPRPRCGCTCVAPPR